MPVYLIQAGERGPVKIGKADNPAERLANLQVAHWKLLRFLRLFDGSEREESMLHNRFEASRIRGEWYAFSRGMLGDVGLAELSLPDIRQSFGKYSSELRTVLEKAGGPTRLARYLGVGPSAVTQWERVPAKHVPRCEVLTGLSGEFIRPDLYAVPAEVNAP